MPNNLTGEIIVQVSVCCILILGAAILHKRLAVHFSGKEYAMLRQGGAGVYASGCGLFLWLVMGWDWLTVGMAAFGLLLLSFYKLLRFYFSRNATL